MYNFVYLAQRCSKEFSCEPNFGGVAVPSPPAPLAAPLVCLCMCVDSDEDAGSSDAVEVQPGSIEYSCWLLTIDFHLLLTYLLSVVSFLYCFSSSVYSVAQERVATVVT